MNKNHKANVHKVGLKNRLQDDVVREIVESPFRFIREKITENDKIENFRIINLGLLYAVESRIKKYKNGNTSEI